MFGGDGDGVHAHLVHLFGQVLCGALAVLQGRLEAGKVAVGGVLHGIHQAALGALGLLGVLHAARHIAGGVPGGVLGGIVHGGADILGGGNLGVPERGLGLAEARGEGQLVLLEVGDLVGGLGGQRGHRGHLGSQLGGLGAERGGLGAERGSFLGGARGAGGGGFDLAVEVADHAAGASGLIVGEVGLVRGLLQLEALLVRLLGGLLRRLLGGVRGASGLIEHGGLQGGRGRRVGLGLGAEAGARVVERRAELGGLLGGVLGVEADVGELAGLVLDGLAEARRLRAGRGEARRVLVHHVRHGLLVGDSGDGGGGGGGNGLLDVVLLEVAAVRFGLVVVGRMHAHVDGEAELVELGGLVAGLDVDVGDVGGDELDGAHHVLERVLHLLHAVRAGAVEEQAREEHNDDRGPDGQQLEAEGGHKLERRERGDEEHGGDEGHVALLPEHELAGDTLRDRPRGLLRLEPGIRGSLDPLLVGALVVVQVVLHLMLAPVERVAGAERVAADLGDALVDVLRHAGQVVHRRGLQDALDDRDLAGEARADLVLRERAGEGGVRNAR